MTGSQDYEPDARNETVLVYVNGELVPRGDAVVSVFDAGFCLGDGVWESFCNSTNFFFVAGGTVCTSSGRACFNGITRGLVIDACGEHGIALDVGDFSLADVYEANEAFVTGTFGGIVPVREIDGRVVPQVPGPATTKLRRLYAERIARETEPDA